MSDTSASHFFYIYPIYFDADKTIAQGRRVPTSVSVKNPQSRDILNALQSFDVPSEIEMNKSHPKSLPGSGRIKCFISSIPKNQLLLKIASSLPKVSTSASTTNAAATSSPAMSVKSTKTVEISPNLIMQPRLKKNKKNSRK